MKRETEIQKHININSPSVVTKLGSIEPNIRRVDTSDFKEKK